MVVCLLAAAAAVVVAMVTSARRQPGGAGAGGTASTGGGAARWTGHWSTNPAAVPSSKTVHGPLLGDGETGAVLGVSAATGSLTAFLSANSFWLLNTDQCDSQGHCEGSHRAGIGGVTAPIVAMSRVRGNRTLTHRLRSRMKTEFGTVRPARKCEKLDPMDGWPACAELIRITHPLYLC